MSNLSRQSWLRTARHFPHCATIIAAAFLVLITVSLTQLDSPQAKLLPTVNIGGYTAHASNLLGHYVEKGKDFVGVGACSGWDPLQSEDNDPARCLKAKQYRQVQRTLAREIKGDKEDWYFTQDINVVTLQRLSKCFLPISHPDYTSCHDRPLIINGYWWAAELVHNVTTGEAIWQGAILKELEKAGIMSIFVGGYSNWVEIAEMMPDVYRFVWGADADIISCFTDPRCIAPEHYAPPEGTEDLSVGVPENERGVIPIWRLQIADYWGARPMEGNHGEFEFWSVKQPGEWSFHSLGSQWIQTPFPLPGHYHLPYSIEEYCLSVPEVPHAERDDTVLVLAKLSDYFHDALAPKMDTWTKLANEPNFSTLSTADVREGYPMPEGLRSVGRQSREAYEGLVGSAKVMLGMGIPRISPSVYTALCQGTPVVLPYVKPKSELYKGGWENYSVAYQHAPAMALGAPYVYSYQINNYTQMVDAINQALTTPIGRYIPEDMKLPYVHSQLDGWLNRDLHEMFKEIVYENGGEVPRLGAGLREQCKERGRCQEPFLAGRRPCTPQRLREVEATR